MGCATQPMAGSHEPMPHSVERNEQSTCWAPTQLPAWQTSYTLPPDMLQPGETYEYSLVVQGDTDNELEIEGKLLTRGVRDAQPSQRR
jgi:hypothetical protein